MECHGGTQQSLVVSDIKKCLLKKEPFDPVSGNTIGYAASLLKTRLEGHGERGWQSKRVCHECREQPVMIDLQLAFMHGHHVSSCD